MSIRVNLPGPLTALAGGASSVDVEGATVGEALQAVFALHPPLRDRILDDRGRVRPHVNVFVGNRSIRESGLATPLPDGSAVSLIPAVSGGLS
jgi:molybdopterin converting factor small subunit